MKEFKILNLVTKILLSSGRTRKLINVGVLTRTGGGGLEIFSENNKLGKGKAFIKDLKVTFTFNIIF